MHDDNRQRNTGRTTDGRPRSATPPSRPAGGTSPAQRPANGQTHTNIQRRGTSAQPMHPTRKAGNGTASGTQGRPQQFRTNGSRQSAGSSAPVGNSNRAVQLGDDETMTVRSVQPVQQNTESGVVSWFKKTFAVDRKVIEERNIVREKGSIDYVFLIIVFVMIAFGTVMVYSASYAYSMNTYGDSYYIIFRQIIFAVVGMVAMAFAAWFRPEWYRKLSVWIYLFCFVLLCAVPLIGREHNGAKRWISLGFTEIQPSEFMKLGLVLLLAWYFDRYYERITDSKKIIRASFFGVFVPIVITGITCFMVIIEKHLSGTIIMFFIGVIIIFASGTALRLLFGFGAVGTLGLGAVAVFTDYTKRRIDIWLHPELDPQGGGYQTLQGLYAIGSGGIFGKGLGNSYQKHLFVSQPQNDFIFTIVCEELGFVGALGVIALFVLLVWRGFVIAMKAPDTFSALVVIGIIGKVVLQALLNIAVVTNSIPNTGISLPFFSYGGSSLVVLMIEMGIVLSISRYSKQKR